MRFTIGETVVCLLRTMCSCPPYAKIITVSDNDIIEVSHNDDEKDDGGELDWSTFNRLYSRTKVMC
jgi:hypothetical protein